MIGAKNFSEQYILADLMADRLEKTAARGWPRKNDLGSVIAFRALAGNEIDALRGLFGHPLDHGAEAHGHARRGRSCWPR